MVTPQNLLQVLADGKYHSGSELGQVFGVSRAAIWKVIQKIEDSLGLTIFAVKGKGYRLNQPLELLDKNIILSNLSEATSSQISQLEILFDVDSTNHYLNSKSLDGALTASVVVAEHQTNGQGRRGRTWVSPFGGNLYLSLLWRFPQGPAQLGCLGLAIAVAIVRVLHQMGVKDAGVKWPNDIYWHDKKLAGILLEMRGESSGPSAVVIGIGANIAMPVSNSDPIDKIDQPWIDLESILKEKVERNHFTALIIDEVFKVVRVFPQQQKELLDEWQAMDVLKGQPIEVNFPDKVLVGTASGINHDGALRLQCGGKEVICHSGEVSIRRG
ncbi:MAG: bifunctional biotin--[acetyl-CoA-carboxylase] ligase/biotin operon repressor BirA [Gammaproteobacteria bacterium]|nr:bifunctional biotin--[acetyl-CoA-carboxylase] ligase/biotin operon repressor BirA [Gammaproteobacteria bacterium]